MKLQELDKHLEECRKHNNVSGVLLDIVNNMSVIDAKQKHSLTDQQVRKILNVLAKWF